MKATEFIIEGKKNRRDVKRTIKPRSPVAHAAQSVAKGSGEHKNKKYEIPRKAKHKTVDVVGEEFNGEYDDEAGMADNNLETMKRAVAGIDNVIHSGDNLPEWCQEKIAVAKSMLVAVWDYMESEERRVGENSNNTPFAGAKVGHREGPAGQWRNKGPKANKPAKAGDLVGGM
jgi:hypothetical protein